MVIGAGCLQLLPYMLAAAHALNPNAVRLTCLLLLLLLLPDAAQILVGAVQHLGAISKPIDEFDHPRPVQANASAQS
jgi:hypothetical protein